MNSSIERYKELTEQIESLLALPLPVPAEKHLLREKLVELEYQRLSETESFEGEKRWQFARAFALEMVPQRVASYPMHLRETRMFIVSEAEARHLYELCSTYAGMRREIDALARLPGNETTCREQRIKLAQLEFERARASDPTRMRTDEQLMESARRFAGMYSTLSPREPLNSQQEQEKLLQSLARSAKGSPDAKKTNGQ